MIEKTHYVKVLIIQLVCLAIGFLSAVIILIANMELSFSNVLKWGLFLTVFYMLIANVITINKLARGAAQIFIFFISAILLASIISGYVLYAIFNSSFNFNKIDWWGSLNKAVSVDFMFYGTVLLFIILYVFIYCFFIDRKFYVWVRGGILGKGKLKQIDTNLENSRWLNEEEKAKLFKHYEYSELDKIEKDGIPVLAELENKNKDLRIAFNSPCHSIIIGSTGSGKTTTFVNPMIQILGATKAGSSMIITDPKGELFSLHSKYLKDRGYNVVVIDLRDTYSSSRWNPLDNIYDNYQAYANAQNNVYQRTDNVEDSGLELANELETFDLTWYEFDNKAYSKYDDLVRAIKIYKKRTFDEVYEDLNDLVSVLVPVENDKDPMWEKGARSIVLSVLLAMLEDSENPELGMTKDKYNFFNMTKILQNSANDYAELRNYFAGRSVLSRAYSLSKQVCDCAEQTRASYMSIVYEKLTMFNDIGICGLTSSSDFSSEDIAMKPTALFLKIPDEKDTRHNLAAIFILNIYKTLIKVASSYEDLSLKRNVYFILDEFGNMPRIEKFDKMITVGRSRKIWFNMIIQSYAQLNNVYGDTVADIVKGNCGIKMFIGSNDMNTCKEYSELCGNITVVTASSSSTTGGNDMNITNQTQVRPLIYPSELQRLNKPGDIGHSIIVTFGNYPLKTYFAPSFKVPFYKIGMMDISDIKARYFDENAIFYDVTKRNKKILEEQEQDKGIKLGGKVQRPKGEEEYIPEDTPDVIEEIKEEEAEEELEDKDERDYEILKFLKMYRDFKAKNPDVNLDELAIEEAKLGKR
ncbi:MAG: type IV secretory system conjugative DNA transfer family protein [Acholeplasmatales bacterium]|nr:type IV secretory system conjugative DNA transfer family protein [Acholeplasmatales bacterium]